MNIKRKNSEEVDKFQRYFDPKTEHRLGLRRQPKHQKEPQYDDWDSEEDDDLGFFWDEPEEKPESDKD